MSGRAVLGVAWLEGRMSACVLSRGALTARWDKGDAVVTPEALPDAIQEAVRSLGFQGNEVFFVVASRRFTCQRVEAPPAKDAVFARLLERKVRQIKPFQDDVVWGYQESDSLGPTRGAIVQMLPASVFTQALDACDANELWLTGLFTPIDALSKQLRDLSVSGKGNVLLATETHGIVHLVAGDKKGKPIFARSFSGTMNPVEPDPGSAKSPESKLKLSASAAPSQPSARDREIRRIGQEINRSLVYCEGQLDQTIEDILWLGAEEEVEAIGSVLEKSIYRSPVSKDPYYWITETSGIRAKSARNMVPATVLDRRKSKVMFRTTVLGLIVFGLIFLGSAISIETLLRNEKALLGDSVDARAEAQVEKAALQESLQEVEARIKFLESFVPSPRASMWYGVPIYVDQVMPEDWKLTLIEAEQADEGIALTLQGFSGTSPRIVSASLTAFKKRLQDGIFEIEESLVGETSLRVFDGSGDIQRVNGFRALVRLKEIRLGEGAGN